MDEFEAAIRAVCEPIFARPLKEIYFGKLLLRLFQTSRRFNVEIQPQLVLLQKTLLNIEGLGRELDPDLDLWHTAKPFLERWMSEQVGWRGPGAQPAARGAVLGRRPCRSCRAWCTARSRRHGAQRSGCRNCASTAWPPCRRPALIRSARRRSAGAGRP